MKAQLFVTAVILASAPLVAAPLGDNQTPSGTAKQGDQQITVSGCIQREADYRKAQDKGRGGVAGTGVGAGDEYVLTNLSMAGADEKKGSEASTAYELTGANEKLAAPHVGHRVEISGTLKAAEVGTSGKPTGGASAGKPPSGVDVLSKDLQLRELEVATVKMVAAKCP
jgi:hypothetical protein